MTTQDELPPRYSRPWYSEYFRRADASETHAEFCRRVYGMNLCQHGMMDMEELGELIPRIPHGKRILEIGCGIGRISEVIHARVAPSFMLAVDYADAAISLAQQRTLDRAATLQFKSLDLTIEDIPDGPYDVVILIDSIYFLGDFAASIKRFYDLLAPGGTMLLVSSELERPGEPPEMLLPHTARAGTALRKLGLAYEAADYSHKMREHWTKNDRATHELEQAFTAEGNRFIFEARASETAEYIDAVRRNVVSRTLYTVRRPG
jgi:2-polyprenyl-3-methyl-5-hydroxy-6-metoxy-1,4-benzoquinol methylase